MKLRKYATKPETGEIVAAVYPEIFVCKKRIKPVDMVGGKKRLYFRTQRALPGGAEYSRVLSKTGRGKTNTNKWEFENSPIGVSP